MINSITNPYASNLLGQYPAQDKNTSSSHDQIAASSSGRGVHDKVDLSPKAAETWKKKLQRIWSKPTQDIVHRCNILAGS